MNKDKMTIALMVLSLLSTVSAGYVFLTQNSLFGLAGTQWILLAILLAVYSNHVHHCPLFKGGACCKSEEPKM